jgi:hypothetical protein
MPVELDVWRNSNVSVIFVREIRRIAFDIKLTSHFQFPIHKLDILCCNGIHGAIRGRVS